MNLLRELKLGVTNSATSDIATWPTTNMCVLKRTVVPQLRAYVDDVLAQLTWKKELLCEIGCPALGELVPGESEHPGREIFLADLSQQVGLVAGLTGVQQVRVKLQCFGESNMCEKFHRDRVVMRLVCTYAGPGTEWIREGESEVQHMERFAIGLMKGELWPDNNGKRVLHRSPPIKGTGIRRVMFQIDVVG